MWLQCSSVQGPKFALYVGGMFGAHGGFVFGYVAIKLGKNCGLQWKSLFGRCVWCEGGGKVVGMEL